MLCCYSFLYVALSWKRKLLYACEYYDHCQTYIPVYMYNSVCVCACVCVFVVTHRWNLNQSFWHHLNMKYHKIPANLWSNMLKVTVHMAHTNTVKLRWHPCRYLEHNKNKLTGQYKQWMGKYEKHMAKWMKKTKHGWKNWLVFVVFHKASSTRCQRRHYDCELRSGKERETYWITISVFLHGSCGKTCSRQ